MFLTPEELTQASGRSRPKAQLAWALARGFITSERMTDADGRPLVLRSLFNPAQHEPLPTQPNFGALRG